MWDDSLLHHHFRLVERTTGSVLTDSIEIHTVELSKYNGTREGIRGDTVLEQWCYWIKNADEHTEGELRELLPDLAFLRATTELRAIQEITQEKEMYDSREKAILDYESNLIDARNDGIAKGEAIGITKGEAIGVEKGIEIGRIQLLQELLEVPVSTKAELQPMSIEQLSSMINLLQEKLRDRKS